MDTNKAPQGTFTKIPNVLLDTCDLSDEAIMLFGRLLRQVGHKGGIFHGSIRKLASVVQVKRDKAHRNLNVLKAAKLVSTGTDSDLDVSTIELHTDDLWELNIAYNDGIEIPRWTNLQETLALVRKIRQQRKDEQSQKSDEVSEKSDTSGANTGQSVRETGQSVRPSEHKVPPKNEKNINTNKTKKECTPLRSASFTSEQNRIDELFFQCTKKRPVITDDLKGYWDTLAPDIKTLEDMRNLYAIAEKECAGKPNPRVYPGNLVDCLKLWRQQYGALPWSQPDNSQSDPTGEQKMDEETYAGHPLDYWTEERMKEAQLTKIQRRTILRLQQEQTTLVS